MVRDPPCAEESWRVGSGRLFLETGAARMHHYDPAQRAGQVGRGEVRAGEKDNG